MKKLKSLKLSKKTISSLSDIEMSYVKGAYGTPSVNTYTCPPPPPPPPGGGSGGGTGGGNGYGGGTGFGTSLYGTFASQGCAGLGEC